MQGNGSNCSRVLSGFSHFSLRRGIPAYAGSHIVNLARTGSSRWPDGHARDVPITGRLDTDVP